MRRDRLTCDLVAGVAPLLAELRPDAPLPARLAEHVGSCLRCQAELARQRRTGRALAALRDDVLEPPPGAIAATLAALEAAAAGDLPVPTGPARLAAVAARRPGHVGGVAAAAGGAAAVAGVLVWRTSRRRPLAG